MLKHKKVIASVFIKDGKYLIAQRGKADEIYGKWEFPGGKMEENETEKECLKRELFEEFNITAQVGEYFCSSFFEIKGIPIEMKAYWVLSYTGDLTLTEHLHIKWVSKEELLNYSMPDPDLPIVNALLNLK